MLKGKYQTSGVVAAYTFYWYDRPNIPLIVINQAQTICKMGGVTDFGWTHNVPHRRFKIYWLVSYVVRLLFVAAIVTHWIDVVGAICFLQEF